MRRLFVVGFYWQITVITGVKNARKGKDRQIVGYCQRAKNPLKMIKVTLMVVGALGTACKVLEGRPGNTQKNHVDLMRMVVTRVLVKDHLLKPVEKKNSLGAKW